MCLSVFCELCYVTVNIMYVKMNKSFANIFLKDFLFILLILQEQDIAKIYVPILYFYKLARAKYSKKYSKNPLSLRSTGVIDKVAKLKFQ